MWAGAAKKVGSVNNNVVVLFKNKLKKVKIKKSNSEGVV
jgi:sporulation protein YlmC with PRC-barrel domain